MPRNQHTSVAIATKRMRRHGPLLGIHVVSHKLMYDGP